MAEQGAPSGVVTFLFTDMESSTWLVQHLGDRWDEALYEHDRLLREAWAAHNGYEVSTEGDAFFVAFEHARDAICAALDAQQRLAAHAFEAPIRVRIGLHTGEARVYGNDYVGLTVHQAARVKSAAHGGQVIVSDATKNAAADVCAFVDLGLHRLKDLAQPVRLFQAGVGEFPAPKTLTVMPNNFPVQSTTFVGRGDDIAAVKDLLGTSRLVTLTGAGGVGKTRLALEVAADLIDEFGDGAWLIDLAPLSDPDGVARQTAEALGVREQPGRDITATVADDLLAKRVLLVLDNCEHVIDTSAEFVHRLLTTCPHVKVLATSREALNVAGETTYRLRSLAVPDVDVGNDLAPVARAESVRLFTQRAVAVRTGFELTADNAVAVSQICRRLDGLPLAIELAAARAKVMSPQEIVERLDDRFRLLTGGTRMALPRQRTLEATVSWSYDLLSDHERVFFDRLSVFAGGCTLEAAERVCTGAGIESFEVLDILTQLVDRSLVVAEATTTGTTRYRLLETLRQFGRDRLLARGEVEKVRDRLLAWTVELAAKLPVQTGAMLPPEIVADEENLRAAIEWAIETGDHAPALHVLGDLWTTGGHRAFPERERWHQALLPSIDRVPKEVACRVLVEAAGLSFTSGDWAVAAKRFRQTAAAALEVGDTHIGAFSLLLEGGCAWGLNEDDRALQLFEQGLSIATDSQDAETVQFGLILLAWAHSDRDVDAALETANQVDELSRREGTPFNRAHSREVLGYVQAVRGELATARATLAEALHLFVDVLVICSAHMLETAATLLTMEDRLEQAAELVGAAERIREETGDRPRPWERTVQEVWLPKIRASLEESVYEAALLRGGAMPREEALAYAGRLMSEPR